MPGPHVIAVPGWRARRARLYFYVLPPSTSATPGNPGEIALLPGSLAELDALGLRIREAAFDGGFAKNATVKAIDASPRSPRRSTSGLHHRLEGAELQTKLSAPLLLPRRCQGRISHIKHGCGLRRSCLRGHE